MDSHPTFAPGRNPYTFFNEQPHKEQFPYNGAIFRHTIDQSWSWSWIRFRFRSRLRFGQPLRRT